MHASAHHGAGWALSRRSRWIRFVNGSRCAGRLPSESGLYAHASATGTLSASDDPPCMHVLTTARASATGTLSASDDPPCMHVLTTALRAPRGQGEGGDRVDDAASSKDRGGAPRAAPAARAAPAPSSAAPAAPAATAPATAAAAAAGPLHGTATLTHWPQSRSISLTYRPDRYGRYRRPTVTATTYRPDRYGRYRRPAVTATARRLRPRTAATNHRWRSVR